MAACVLSRFSFSRVSTSSPFTLSLSLSFFLSFFHSFSLTFTGFPAVVSLSFFLSDPPADYFNIILNLADCKNTNQGRFKKDGFPHPVAPPNPKSLLLLGNECKGSWTHFSSHCSNILLERLLSLQIAFPSFGSKRR